VVRSCSWAGAGSISLTLREPQALATAELYEPSSDRWILLAPMHSTRDHHTATLLPSGRLLVVGGAFTSTPLAELFDLARNAWVEVNGQALNRYAHTATLLADGRVLITGGYNAPSMASTWIYDPAGRALSVGVTSPSPGCAGGPPRRRGPGAGTRLLRAANAGSPTAMAVSIRRR